MTRAITLHDVSKTFRGTRGSVRVVDHFSLDISPGEFLVLLGPSGCGKSTVLRLIAGLEEITSGELFLDGEYANDIPPGERRMAMVFQNFALYPSMTSRENIGFPLRFEMPGEDAAPRVDATARTLGIEDLLDRYPAQLSGGERQRVAMGRAISRHPSVFLMDEPLSNLDAKLRSHLRTEIARLTRGMGVTTVYVTHDQAEAMSLGDRVAIMRGGLLQQVCEPRTAYHLPENVFVASFIGTPRINLFQATVAAPLGGGMWIDLGRQRLGIPEPLNSDHQLLRLWQGRQIIVGLRSEAVRIGQPSSVQPGEVVLSGIVEHVEYQGHESLVHLNTGSRPAVVPELEDPSPDGERLPDHHSRTDGRDPRTDGRDPRTTRRTRNLGRLVQKATGREPADTATDTVDTAGTAMRDSSPSSPSSPPAATGRRTNVPGDLVVRTGPDLWLRHGDRVPLLVDLAQLYVFDHEGRRICPAPLEGAAVFF